MGSGTEVRSTCGTVAYSIQTIQTLQGSGFSTKINDAIIFILMYFE